MEKKQIIDKKMAFKKIFFTLFVVGAFLFMPIKSLAYQLGINPEIFTQACFESTSTCTGNTANFEIQFINDSVDTKEVFFNVKFPGAYVGWTSNFVDSSLSIDAGNTGKTTLSITSPASVENGAYYFDIEATVEGVVVEKFRGDFIVSEFDPPSPLVQKGYGINISNGGATFDPSPDFFFSLLGDGSSGYGQPVASGDPSANYFGNIESTHLEDGVVMKIYKDGVVGHLWSDYAGWIILDGDGVPGSDNTTPDDFGADGSVSGSDINLSGRAWGPSAGWIYFSCNDLPSGAPVGCNIATLACKDRGAPNVPDPNNFNVCVDSSDRFHGHAWSENLGWIDFEAVNTSIKKYDIQITKNPSKDFSVTEDIVINYDDESAATPDNYTPSSLDEGGTYHWRVKEKNEVVVDETENEISDWSEVYTVFIKEIPEVDLVSPLCDPGGLSPIGEQDPEFQYEVLDKIGSNLRVTIVTEKWDGVKWDNYYTGTENVVITDVNMQQESYIFPNPFKPGKYRWMVKVEDEEDINGESNKNETGLCEFFIGGDSPSVTCSSPTGSIDDRTPEMNFFVDEPDDEDIKWKIETTDLSNNDTTMLKDYNSFYTTIDSAGENITYPVADEDKFIGGSYSWTVTAIDEDGNQGSDTCNFSINNTDPEITDEYITGDGVTLGCNSDTYDRRPIIYMAFKDEGNVTCGAEISTTSDFNPATIKWNNERSGIDANPTGECTFNINTYLDPGQTYYWRVYVEDEEGLRVYKPDSACMFTIDELIGSGKGNIGTLKITGNILGNPFGTEAEANIAKQKHKYIWSGIDRKTDLPIADTYLGHMTIGWVDFNPTGGGVIVEDSDLRGYAWNEHAGWIRMSCEENDFMEINDNNECGGLTCNCDFSGNCSGSDYCVKNNNGELTGKAYIESYGGYVYFNENSFLQDCNLHPSWFNAGNCTDIANQWPESAGHNGVVIDGEGKFNGYAWNGHIGWVDFNGEDVAPNPADPNSMNYYYPITEWSSDPKDPVIDEDAKGHKVFAAVASGDKEFAIALDNTNEDKGFSCPGGVLDNNPKGDSVDMLALYEFDNTSGTYTAVNTNQYTFVCDINLGADADKYGRVSLSLDGTTLSRRSGHTYRVWGNVYDAAGNVANIPGPSADDADEEANGFSFQIVAGQPYFDLSNTFTYIDPGNAVADGEDAYVFDFNIRDEFGNFIVSEDLPNIITLAPEYRGLPLKTVETQIDFLNTVDTDQSELVAWDEGDAIRYNGNLNGSYRDGTSADPIDTLPYTDEDKDLANNNNNITINVTSFAPTDFLDGDTDDQISLNEIRVVIENESVIYGDGAYLNSDIGMCISSADCGETIVREMTFAPLVTMAVADPDGNLGFDAGVPCEPGPSNPTCEPVTLDSYDFKESTATVVNVKLKNTDSDDSFSQLSWYVNMDAFDVDKNETDLDYLLNHVVIFDNMQMVDDINASNVISNASGICAYGTANSCAPFNSEHEETSPSFNAADSMALSGVFSENIFQATKIDAGTSANLPANYDGNLFISMTPKRISEVVGTDIGMKMTSYIGYKHPACAEFINYPVFVDNSGASFLFREITIGGLAHGEAVHDEAVTNPDDIEFIDVGELLSYSKMSEAIRKNVAAGIRGQRDSSKSLTEDVVINNWTELITDPNVTLIQDGQVIWYHGEHGFNLDIEGDLEIPSAGGPYTLIVEGGNVYLNGNIFDANGRMTSDENSVLGIIILNARDNEIISGAETRSGNLLINPNVTNIKASVFAERSIMSYDGTNIYDGFNYPIEELNKQLYWIGSVVSQNTVGGAQHEIEDPDNSGTMIDDPQIPAYDSLWMPDTPDTCDTIDKFNDGTCNRDMVSGDLSDAEKTAMRFDIAHLRIHKGLPGTEAKDVQDDLKSSSIIILYDSALNKAENVPPLFTIPEEFKFESVIR